MLALAGMKNKVKKASYFLGVIGVPFLFISLSTFAFAQEKGLSASISPVIFELTGNPGEKLTNAIKVTNVSDRISVFTMQVEPFSGDELGRATVIEQGEEDPTHALKKWIKINPEKFTLKPNESKVVEVIISIPRDGEPGGHYASILASSGEDDTSTLESTGAVIKQKVGTLVLLTVAGDIKYKAYIKDFYPTKNIYEKGPIVINTRIMNESTVHIKPKGFIKITNLWGKEVKTIRFEERNALPNSPRFIETKWEDTPSWGRFTASLALIYGDKNETITATTNFIIFPWKIGLPIIFGSLILLWLIFAKRKNIFAAIKVLFGRH